MNLRWFYCCKLLFLRRVITGVSYMSYPCGLSFLYFCEEIWTKITGVIVKVHFLFIIWPNKLSSLLHILHSECCHVNILNERRYFHLKEIIEMLSNKLWEPIMFYEVKFNEEVDINLSYYWTLSLHTLIKSRFPFPVWIQDV